MIDRNIAPQRQDFVSLVQLNPQVYKLSNDIRCLFLPNESVGMIKMVIRIEAGAFFQHKPGIATACINMLKEGTKTRTAEQLAEQLDYFGTYINCGSDKDFSALHIYFPPKATKEVVAILQDILTNPIFPEEQLNIYKQNLLSELSINMEKTSYLAYSRLVENVFGTQHHYGRVLTLDDVSNINRKDLVEFYNTHYHADSIRIFVAGGIDEHFFEVLDNAFGQIQKANKITEEIQSSFPNPQKLYIEKESAVQSSICIGRQNINKTDKRWGAYSLTNLILGGYFGSRLMTNIRENKGLAYHIHSTMQSFVRGGMFYVAADVNKQQAKIAIKEIYAEMEKLKNVPIESAELILVKNYLYGGLMKCFDGVFAQLDLLLDAEKYNLKLDYWEKYVTEIKTMKSETILNTAKELFNFAELSEIVVG